MVLKMINTNIHLNHSINLNHKTELFKTQIKDTNHKKLSV